MEFNTNTILLGVLFGSLGLGYFIYGKNTVNFIAMVAGVALMVVPYFISNVIVLLIVCLVLAVAPYLLRER
jgi:hypothetical protein